MHLNLLETSMYFLENSLWSWVDVWQGGKLKARLSHAFWVLRQPSPDQQGSARCWALGTARLISPASHEPYMPAIGTSQNVSETPGGGEVNTFW